MGVLRGALTGTLALTALQALVGTDRAAGRVSGLMGDLNRLLTSALSPDVPAVPDLRGRRATNSTPLPVAAGSWSGAGTGGGGAWGASAPPRSGADTRTPTTGASRGAAAVTFAREQLGQPYVWGGDGGTEGGFDCSGLTKAAWAAAGVTLPRTAQLQSEAVKRVPAGQERLGDLVFYGSSPSNVTHVALYIGAGMQLDAPRRGAVVSIRPRYPTGYLFTGRPTT